MLAQILSVFAAALMDLLGALHIVYTFFTNKLEPRDAATATGYDFSLRFTSRIQSKMTKSCLDLWPSLGG